MIRRLIIRAVVYGAVAYLILWALTYFHAPRLLQQQMLFRMTEEAGKIQRAIEEDPNSHSSKQLASRVSGGPQATAELLRCPAPFAIKARVQSSIGDFMKSGGERWYLYVPWGVYIVQP